MPAQSDHVSAPIEDPLPPVPRPHAPPGLERAAALKRRWRLRLLILAAIVAGAYYSAPYWLPRVKPLAAGLARKKAAPAPSAARTISVGTAVARTGDMSLYLNGLGSVTAFNTVTLRSRVDGELIRVHFTEGQMVQADSLLAEIDPRPYQVQLAEAEAQSARDDATLEEARANLSRLTALRGKAWSRSRKWTRRPR